MKGVVLRGGADYQYANKELGRTELEAIYSIITKDNVYIHIRNTGLIYNQNEYGDNNSTVKPEVYFRAASRFESPIDSKYAGLNNAFFTCKPCSKKIL